MRGLLGILVLTAVVSNGNGFFSDDDTLGDIVSFIKSSTFMDVVLNIEKCKDKENELEESAKTLSTFILGLKGKETTCKLIEDHFENRTKEIVGIMESCIEPKYHDVPKLAVKTITSAMHYFCTIKGEGIFELLNPCLSSIALHKGPTCLEHIEEVAKQVVKDESTVDVKKAFCKAMGNVKKCFLNQFEHKCGNKITRESAVSLYDAVITQPCGLS